MSFWVWLLTGVKVAGVVGDGVAVVVRHDAVRGRGCSWRGAAQIGARCGGLCGVSAHGMVVPLTWLTCAVVFFVGCLFLDFPRRLVSRLVSSHVKTQKGSDA